MKTYHITSGLTIEGDSLQEAIESCFPRIAEKLHIGNAAGYQLHSVWCEYNEAIETAVLHIIATGSDLLVGYDPTQDPPKEYTLTFHVPKGECPERFDIELCNDPVFDPFDDSCLSSPSAYYGTALGLINEIGLHHCKIKSSDKITMLVTCQYPNTRTTFPMKYIEFCRGRLAKLRPNTDNKTTQLMERLSELVVKAMEYPNSKFDADWLFESKTDIYFRTAGKVTALSAIRKKKNMSQKQLADAAQMSVRQLQNYEKNPGSTLFSASKSVPGRLAEALGVTVSEIIDSTGSAILVDA